MINKTIIQTYKTREIHPPIVEKIEALKEKNKDYCYLFFDDSQILDYIRTSYDNHIFSLYQKLNIGAAKADFFRYLILYKMGGVYCDMDSSIDLPISQIARHEDKAIITREKNFGSFVQWALFFEEGHKVLEETICLVCQKIHAGLGRLNEITGPIVFSQVIQKLYGIPLGVLAYSAPDEFLNKHSKDARFWGYDYEGSCTFKHEASQFLYYPHTETIPWTLDQKKIC